MLEYTADRKRDFFAEAAQALLSTSLGDDVKHRIAQGLTALLQRASSAPPIQF